MRVSTSQIYDVGARNIIKNQSDLYKTQNQLSTGRRILTAEDDPVAASQVLLDTQAREVNSLYADNQSNASAQLALEESRLSSVVDAIQFIKEKVIAGSNASLSDTQREYFAVDLQGQLDALLGIANSADASGHYLFSGFQGATQPFQLLTSGSVQYVGDEGQRLLQVGASRQIAVSDSGREIFLNNGSGNGTFVTSGAPGNTGTGIIDNGTVLNPSVALPTPPSYYQVSFTSGTQYDITIEPAGTSVVSGATYATGAAITGITGVSFAIQGAPAAGDTFTVAASTNRSVFETVQDLITAFRTDIAGDPVAAASVRNTINSNLENLDRALENVSRVQASIGSRRKELEGLSDLSSNLDLQYQEKISDLQDLDYTEAISRFKKQQTQLEAAQNSFVQISGLSLFNYI